jgi:hypothetical protein
MAWHGMAVFCLCCSGVRCVEDHSKTGCGEELQCFLSLTSSIPRNAAMQVTMRMCGQTDAFNAVLAQL